MREKIGPTDLMMDIIEMMSEGNPGAINVMTEMIKGGTDGILNVLSLDDMNIRGSQIWVGFKDFAGQDMKVFKKAITKRDPGMVKMINEQCASYGEGAVTFGGSRR